MPFAPHRANWSAIRQKLAETHFIFMGGAQRSPLSREQGSLEKNSNGAKRAAAIAAPFQSSLYGDV
jgi:hypothetical protein